MEVLGIVVICMAVSVFVDLCLTLHGLVSLCKFCKEAFCLIPLGLAVIDLSVFVLVVLGLVEF